MSAQEKFNEIMAEHWHYVKTVSQEAGDESTWRVEFRSMALHRSAFVAQVLRDAGFTVTWVDALVATVAAPPVTEDAQPLAVVKTGVHLKHPATGRTWSLSAEEAYALFVALRAALETPDAAHHRQRVTVGASPEPEVVYMRTGGGQPEPTAAVKTWRRVVPIDGKPNVLTRVDGPSPHWRIGEPGDGWIYLHPVTSSQRFTWADVTRFGLVTDDVWMSADAPSPGV